MKTIYEERADDFRILAGEEPDFAAGINSLHNACAFRENCRQAEAEIARLREDAGRKYKQAKEYIGKMDAVIDDLNIAKSCINPLEDLKRATTALKERAEKADAALAGEKKLSAAISRDCNNTANERKRAQAKLAALRDVLTSKGFVECDIPACNCGSWHHKYGLPERWAEIKEVLIDADVLNNDTGNMPLNAIKKLIPQLAERDAEIARLREDAERYRWAKDNLFIGYINDDVCSPYDDELIDLARKDTK
tara:strand:+ start:99 stop:851 length:753 start_codon:yes stop_codon:yes gene_type:complete